MPTETLDHARRVIYEMMTASGIPVDSHVSFDIRPETTFEHAVQYTYKHASSSRYKFYKKILGYVTDELLSVGHRIAHIDIGCGSGLFSWALLDWAQEHGIEPDRLGLYGYDYSEEMIRLAEMIRLGVRETYSDYSVLHYFADSEEFLQRLTDDSDTNTDYFITFGYVLAWNQLDEDIDCFSQIIDHILGISGGHGKCFLLVGDAASKGDFVSGWDKLLYAFQESNIELVPVGTVPAGRTHYCVLLSRREA